MTRRKDGRWQERLKIGEKYVYIYGKTKAEVMRKIREYEESTSGALPLSKAIDLWLNEKEKSVAYKTMEGYNAPIKRIKEAFGDVLWMKSPLHRSNLLSGVLPPKVINEPPYSAL